MEITWLGYASVKIKTGNVVIYIDPAIGVHDEKADIIFITHDHPDHWSNAVLKQIWSADTKVYAIPAVASQLLGANPLLQSFKIGDIGVKVFPAYCIRRREHPKGSGIGILFEFDGKRVYYAGDTELIPEMKGIVTDIILVPVGGTSTADAREAVAIVQACKAAIAIPTHWGHRTGTVDDAELFKELVESKTNARAVILQEGEGINL